MKGLMSKLKNKKVISIGLIIILLIAIIVISFVLSNKNSEKDNQEQDNVVNTSTISLNYNVNEDCINYLEDLEVFTYEDLVNSDYSDTLYYTHADEVYEYYLVCLTDLSITIDEEETDLKEAIDSELITLDELDSLLVQEEIDEYMVTPPIEKVEEVTTDEEETDEKDSEEVEETEESTTSSSSSNNSSSSSNKSSSSSSSSSNKSSSSSSSSNSSSSNSSSSSSSGGSSSSSSSSSNSSSSSSSTTMSESECKATINTQLAKYGYVWDFSSKSDAEAFVTKWSNRGFVAGYNTTEVLGCDIVAYTGYVKTGYGYCGLTSQLTVDWRNETSVMVSELAYITSLGYTC